MNTLPFSVCTYNMGSSFKGNPKDYYLLCKHLQPSLTFTTTDQENDFRVQYDNAQRRTSELLTNKAQVYCLQEVSVETRPLIESLKTKNFEIIHLGGIPHFDTAIALDKNRFKNIINHSIDIPIPSSFNKSRTFNKDVAIATATDTLTGERVTFVSAHVPGFDLTLPIITDKETSEGDFYCRAIVKKLSKIGKGTLHVIGSDMNANPEKWGPRFQVFSRQGFQLHRTNSSTNVNPTEPKEQEREIDFIFTKTTSIWQKIKSIFVSTVQFKTTIKNENSIGWNEKDNASDHLPVFIDISHTMTISKIRQLWNATCHLLSSCFRTQQRQTT